MNQRENLIRQTVLADFTQFVSLARSHLLAHTRYRSE